MYVPRVAASALSELCIIISLFLDGSFCFTDVAAAFFVFSASLQQHQAPQSLCAGSLVHTIAPNGVQVKQSWSRLTG